MFGQPHRIWAIVCLVLAACAQGAVSGGSQDASMVVPVQDAALDAPFDAGEPDVALDAEIPCVETCDTPGPCEVGPGRCVQGHCVYPPAQASVECRPSAGPCDVAESCDGVHTTCPADTFQASSFECRASAGPCDVAETCTGSSAACPADSLVLQGTQCRASAGPCDLAEACTGTSALCPADGFKSSSTECRASAGACDVAELCTGSSAACPPDNVQPNGFTCRTSAGPCDLAEQCNGSSPACPSDTFQTSGTTCRYPAGPCDVAETCTGSSAACPVDTFQPNSFTCRYPAGPCDVAEMCTGTGAACPADGFQSSNVTCRTSAGPCDVAEKCTGSSAGCPADGYQPNTVQCRASAGVCDIAEMCTGSGAACPPDAFQSSLLVCRPAVGSCDVAESCTGSSAACPANAFLPNGYDLGIPCDGPDSDQCKRGTEKCNGSGGQVCTGDTPNSVEICNDADDDCDGVIDNGFDKQNDIFNCGSCNTHCVNGHGSTSCSTGSCHPACSSFFGDMDGNPVNGCECDGTAWEPSSLPNGGWPELPYSGAASDGNNFSDCDHKDSYFANLVPAGDDDFWEAYVSDKTFCTWEPKVYLSSIPQGTDYDLYLYKWNGSAWVYLTRSFNGGSNDEYIDFSNYGGEGWYGFQVQRYSGLSCGNYKLTICDGSTGYCAP